VRPRRHGVSGVKQCLCEYQVHNLGRVPHHREPEAVALGWSECALNWVPAGSHPVEQDQRQYIVAKQALSRCRERTAADAGWWAAIRTSVLLATAQKRQQLITVKIDESSAAAEAFAELHQELGPESPATAALLTRPASPLAQPDADRRRVRLLVFGLRFARSATTNEYGCDGVWGAACAGVLSVFSAVAGVAGGQDDGRTRGGACGLIRKGGGPTTSCEQCAVRIATECTERCVPASRSLGDDVISADSRLVLLSGSRARRTCISEYPDARREPRTYPGAKLAPGMEVQ
jgi:hypothetical protein